MGADGAVPVKKPLFAKPSIDDMGPGTDMPTPAGAVSRSLFKKQSAQEAHGSDFGIPGDATKPLFKKNSLDEMTVRRTEKPIEGKVPAKPQPISPLVGEIGSFTAVALHRPLASTLAFGVIAPAHSPSCLERRAHVFTFFRHHRQRGPISALRACLQG